ncbi:MAG: double-CXXCG motif protein [Blastocatellales bacterium]
MDIFEVVSSNSEISKCGLIDASHKWNLPGVKCRVCHTTWGNVGMAYPRVNLRGTKFEDAFIDPYPVELERLEELRQSIKHLVPEGLPLPPGTQFGPLIGIAEGPYCDFVWHHYWDILVKMEVINSLASEKTHLPKVSKPKLEFRGKYSANLVELQIEPLVTMVFAQSSFNVCSACGRLNESRPEEIVIDSSKLPEDIDLFRVTNFSTVILANDRFVNSVKKLGLTGISFNSVKLA